jgi:hypothetical protein
MDTSFYDIGGKVTEVKMSSTTLVTTPEHLTYTLDYNSDLLEPVHPVLVRVVVSVEPPSVIDTPILLLLSLSGTNSPRSAVTAGTTVSLIDLKNPNVIGYHVDELVSDTNFADIATALADDKVKAAIAGDFVEID